MTHSRRQKIEAMLQDEPDDIFLRYSLALLMEADGEWEASLDILQELARGAPPYVPAYQMAAQHLAKYGKPEDARRALREGIEEARRQDLTHAAGEMAELLVSIGDA
jgi:predicted Zn-dependent protease